MTGMGEASATWRWLASALQYPIGTVTVTHVLKELLDCGRSHGARIVAGWKDQSELRARTSGLSRELNCLLSALGAAGTGDDGTGVPDSGESLFGNANQLTKINHCHQQLGVSFTTYTAAKCRTNLLALVSGESHSLRRGPKDYHTVDPCLC